MILEKGNMWDIYDETDLFLITTNSSLDNKEHLVMGSGIAREAKEKFPCLPYVFGNVMCNGSEYGLLFIKNTKIGCFQVKTDWREIASLKLIEKSTDDLCYWLKRRPLARADLNFPGIGCGKLKREDVLPIISRLPDNVHVWEKK